jgi:hypothetical protein
MRSGWLSRGACLCAALALAGPAAVPAAGGPGRGEEALVTLGAARTEIRFPTPVRYAIVLQQPGRIRLLYARGNILFHPQDPTRSLTVERVEAEALVVRQGPRGRGQTLKAGGPMPGFPGLTFTRTVLLDQLHYRYKVVERIQHPDPVLVALEGSRAILDVEVVHRASASAQAPPSSIPPGAVRPGVVAPPAGQPTPPARATLDAEVLDKVRVREVSPGLYEVPAADVQAVLENTGRVLADLAPMALPTLSLQTGLQYRVTSAAGDGVLTSQGFTITAPKLAERAGIQVGDTILSVNGQPVDGFASLYRMFRDVRRDPALNTVQVELDRGGTRLTKTYRIR